MTKRERHAEVRTWKRVLRYISKPGYGLAGLCGALGVEAVSTAAYYQAKERLQLFRPRNARVDRYWWPVSHYVDTAPKRGNPEDRILAACFLLAMAETEAE